jgi:8-oxo-dGTP diphosphatase
MRSASVPDPAGSGDRLDQHTGDPVWRLRAPGAGGAPWQDRTANPVAPARSGHRPRSGRWGVRREYDHQPDALAASCVAPCAFAAVRDIAGRLLLVRRCDTGDWELPGGHVDPGESASDAAVRETAEESGMTVEVTGLVGIYTDPGHVIAGPRAGLVRQPFAVCFHARPLSGNPGGDQVETSDARWSTAGDIPALPIGPAMRLRIGHALTPWAPLPHRLTAAIPGG